MDNRELIQSRTEEILKILNLYKIGTSFSSQLEEILKIYKFVVQNINSNSKYVERKYSNSQENYINILSSALINNPGLPTTNSVLFKHLLDVNNIENAIVLCKSVNSDDFHIANLVKIGEQFYYFDTTLEKTIQEQKDSNNSKNLFMICAALGKDDYERIYKPISILKSFSDKPQNGLPTNISRESISKTILNSINYKLPDYSSKLGSEKSDQEEIEF